MYYTNPQVNSFREYATRVMVPYIDPNGPLPYAPMGWLPDALNGYRDAIARTIVQNLQNHAEASEPRRYLYNVIAIERYRSDIFEEIFELAGFLIMNSLGQQHYPTVEESIAVNVDQAIKLVLSGIYFDGSKLRGAVSLTQRELNAFSQTYTVYTKYRRYISDYKANMGQTRPSPGLSMGGVPTPTGHVSHSMPMGYPPRMTPATPSPSPAAPSGMRIVGYDASGQPLYQPVQAAPIEPTPYYANGHGGNHQPHAPTGTSTGAHMETLTPEELAEMPEHLRNNYYRKLQYLRMTQQAPQAQPQPAAVMPSHHTDTPYIPNGGNRTSVPSQPVTSAQDPMTIPFTAAPPKAPQVAPVAERRSGYIVQNDGTVLHQGSRIPAPPPDDQRIMEPFELGSVPGPVEMIIYRTFPYGVDLNELTYISSADGFDWYVYDPRVIWMPCAEQLQPPGWNPMVHTRLISINRITRNVIIKIADKREFMDFEKHKTAEFVDYETKLQQAQEQVRLEDERVVETLASYQRIAKEDYQWVKFKPADKAVASLEQAKLAHEVVVERNRHHESQQGHAVTTEHVVVTPVRFDHYEAFKKAIESADPVGIATHLKQQLAIDRDERDRQWLQRLNQALTEHVNQRVLPRLFITTYTIDSFADDYQDLCKAVVETYGKFIGEALNSDKDNTLADEYRAIAFGVEDTLDPELVLAEYQKAVGDYLDEAPYWVEDPTDGDSDTNIIEGTPETLKELVKQPYTLTELKAKLRNVGIRLKFQAYTFTTLHSTRLPEVYPYLDQPLSAKDADLNVSSLVRQITSALHDQHGVAHTNLVQINQSPYWVAKPALLDVTNQVLLPIKG